MNLKSWSETFQKGPQMHNISSQLYTFNITFPSFTLAGIVLYQTSDPTAVSREFRKALYFHRCTNRKVFLNHSQKYLCLAAWWPTHALGKTRANTETQLKAHSCGLVSCLYSIIHSVNSCSQYWILGLPRWHSGKESICLPSRRHGFNL